MAKNHGVGPARPRSGRPKRKELIEVRAYGLGVWARMPRNARLSQTLDGRLYDRGADMYFPRERWRVNGYWSGRKAVQA